MKTKMEIGERMIRLVQANRTMIFLKKKDRPLVDCFEIRLINGEEVNKHLPINLNWFQIVRKASERVGQTESMGLRGPFGDFFEIKPEHFELIYQLSLKD